MIYQDINFKIGLRLFGWKENLLPKEHIVQCYYDTLVTGLSHPGYWGTSPWCMWFPPCNYKDARAPKLSSGHLQPSMETAQVSPTTVSFSENIFSLNES